MLIHPNTRSTKANLSEHGRLEPSWIALQENNDQPSIRTIQAYAFINMIGVPHDKHISVSIQKNKGNTIVIGFPLRGSFLLTIVVAPFKHMLLLV